jgi:outer membrane protein assembly factor BamB
VSLWLTSPPARAENWDQWRGPEQTGVSRDTGLPDRFAPDKPGENNLIWKAPYGGRTTPIVMNGKVYLINQVGEGLSDQERVMCLDEKTGDKVWEYRFNVWLTDIVTARVGWTQLAADPETGNVYAHGTQGLLYCFDGKDGKVLWSHSLTEEYGRISGYGGRITSPIIDGDLLIVGMINASWGEQARGGNRFLAVNKKTGEPVWWGETGLPVKDTYACTPVVATINGERLMFTGGGDQAVHAFKVATGEKVWSLKVGEGAINASPVVAGNLVYFGHGEENLEGGERGRVVCVDASKVKDGKPELVWSVEGVVVRYTSPALHQGRLYVCDDSAVLHCYDAKKGDELWTYAYGRSGRGSPVWADGKIYVGAVNGKFSILKPGDSGCEELQAITIPSRIPRTALEISGSPSVANGRVYFMTNQDTYCIGTPEGKVVGVTTAGVEPAPADATPTHLQVVPADVMLAPGGTATFKARLFDAKGRFLREEKAEWSVAPMLPPPPLPGQPAKPGAPPPALQGQMDADGKLTLAKAPPGQFGGVVAKAAGLTGRARVRVAPPLPYAQDFEKVPEERTPGGWVNTQGKFAVKEVGGSKVLAKLVTNPSPLVARAHAFITGPDASDYTIETDLQGTKKGDNLPDMGVINCRYTLQLAGAYQQLRLMSWEAVPRVDKSISFPWKPDTWYRMKFRVEVKDGKALVQGKVWERGQQEPQDWTVSFEDPTPNKEGSAGLYAVATGVGGPNDPGTNIYYDNVKVTPNKK